jgi:hypothetical protein
MLDPYIVSTETRWNAGGQKFILRIDAKDENRLAISIDDIHVRRAPRKRGEREQAHSCMSRVSHMLWPDSSPTPSLCKILSMGTA